MSYNPPAQQIGHQILDAGGNAFDAFIAATFAEYVLAAGETSMAGPLSALVLHAGKVQYLDGDYNWFSDPAGLSTPDHPEAGREVLVPGAVAALELLSRTYGRLPFARVIEPAAVLAEQGFPVTPIYSALIRAQAPLLKQTEYGRTTFFTPDGNPLAIGATLRLPVVASLLRQLEVHGAAYMYTGPWAQEAVKVIAAAGGKMTAADLAAYRAALTVPRRIDYKGYQVYGAPDRSFASFSALLQLKVLEQTQLPAAHYSRDAGGLEVMVRIFRQIAMVVLENTPPGDFLDPARDAANLSEAAARAVWQAVAAQIQQGAPAPGASTPIRGTHSFQIMVADADGNVITGTNTINGFPWGNGLFVEGVPLNPSGAGGTSTAYFVALGQRAANDRDNHIVFRDGKFVFATGAINTGLLPANIQFIVNKIDYGLGAVDNVNAPRFGDFPLNVGSLPLGGMGTVDLSANYLDPRVAPDIVSTLKARGLNFTSTGLLYNTGDGGVIETRPEGGYLGAYSPVLY
jgi:gamma-glutamyltranspeptidase/glutathione hydrolase